MGTLIDGSGVVNNTGLIRILDGDKIFPVSANLTFGPGEVRVWNNLTMSNYGNLNFTGVINGRNAGSTWINEAGSRVDVGNIFFLHRIACGQQHGKHVHYYRTGADVNLTRTSDSSYYQSRNFRRLP